MAEAGVKKGIVKGIIKFTATLGAGFLLLVVLKNMLAAPSEDGYRVFVGQMVNQAELPRSIQQTITHQFYQSRPDVDEWMTLAASVLVGAANGVVIATLRMQPFVVTLATMIGVRGLAKWLSNNENIDIEAATAAQSGKPHLVWESGQ